MGILLHRETKAIVQGLTGKGGSFHVRIMREYGTRVVAGVTPGKGGLEHERVPVFDTVTEARAATGAGIASSPWEMAAMTGKYAEAR